ncbi:putative sphingolipid c9-methyltransferase [Erysiphe neolycopersici]|uniref:Conserved oligomeric Golgi complex subunit 1 n=1 Tax=Erysiphe neolycopersici TaxID=212602 RepID=A0A420HR67_9PEZI|nr:putative sphingolipid c9-methyltransferase [Erysiphe neolycopersici]
MTSNKPRDLSECRTVSEIFSHSLPQVRQVHRNLTVELDEKKSRLRTLVGGSYRQLLGTADTISHMNEVIRIAEENLTRVSHACRKSSIDDLATGLNKFYKRQKKGKQVGQLQWFARVKALDLQILTVRKLLHKNEAGNDSDNRETPLILAVRIHVISTLLLRSVEELEYQESESCQRLVLEIRRKLDAQHCKLLDAIEKALKRDVKNSQESITQSLTAYSLTTNSDIIDVLGYFLDLREAVVANYFTEDSQNISTGVVKAIILFAWTLLDTPIIFSRGLSKNLSSLKVKPFLKDKSIKDIEELRLDEFENWLSDIVLCYRPGINHEIVDKSLTVDILKAWETKISKLILQKLSKLIESQVDLKTLIDMRNKIFNAWIEEGEKIENVDILLFLRELRNVINGSIFRIIQQRCEGLLHVFKEIKITVASWEPGVNNKQASLWDKSILEIDVSNGADLFKKSIIARKNGRNDTVLRVFLSYQKWRESVDEILLYIDQIKSQKWYSDYEDIEEDMNVVVRCDMLNIEDSQLLQQHLDLGLSKAFKEMQEEIESLIALNEKNTNLGQISIYIFRIIRDIRSNLPPNNDIQGFGITMFNFLYDKLALTVIGDSILVFIEAIEKQRITGRVLWEGDPELTVQPSPAAFKLLYNLAINMAKAGHDLWTPNAILVLKRLLSDQLINRWNEALKEKFKDEENATNIESQNKENLKSNNLIKEIMIQAFFDYSLILNRAFRHDDLASNTSITNLEALIISRGELNVPMQERISESALNYWKKTHLLFGILE